MRRSWVHAFCCLALPVMIGQLTVEAQENATRRITVTITHEAEPFAGIIMAPVPPSTASQRVVSYEMVVKTLKGTTKAVLGQEVSPFKKRILTVAANPDEKMQIVFKVEVDLLQAPGPVKVGMTTPTLTKEQRSRYTEAGSWCYQHDSESFRAWMTANGLLKGNKESGSPIRGPSARFHAREVHLQGPR